MFNKTNVVLVPKKKDPTIVTNYRPISLCNVTYKIVIKSFANCLKGILPTIIAENQSIFVPIRLISDNEIITQEIIHSLCKKNNGKKGFMGFYGFKVRHE